MIIRQIFLDTETTGINKSGPHYKGHGIIEIGAVESINRRLTGKTFHSYIKPNCLVDFEAFKIHGISNDFLKDKPSFSDIAADFLNFVYKSEVIIHNAPFDIGFIDYELSKLNKNMLSVRKFLRITDSLSLARKIFPGKKNNLNALCDRYHINNSKRKLHGALLDAELLAKVYMAMTGGQVSLDFSRNAKEENKLEKSRLKYDKNIQNKLKIVYADKEELKNHERKLDFMEKSNGENSLWRINNK